MYKILMAYSDWKLYTHGSKAHIHPNKPLVHAYLYSEVHLGTDVSSLM